MCFKCLDKVSWLVRNIKIVLTREKGETYDKVWKQYEVVLYYRTTGAFFASLLINFGQSLSATSVYDKSIQFFEEGLPYNEEFVE